jgi:hypothetical protein
MISVVNSQIQTIQRFEELIVRTTRKRDNSARDSEVGRKRSSVYMTNQLEVVHLSSSDI